MPPRQQHSMVATVATAVALASALAEGMEVTDTELTGTAVIERRTPGVSTPRTTVIVAVSITTRLTLITTPRKSVVTGITFMSNQDTMTSTARATGIIDPVTREFSDEGSAASDTDVAFVSDALKDNCQSPRVAESAAVPNVDHVRFGVPPR